MPAGSLTALPSLAVGLSGETSVPPRRGIAPLPATSGAESSRSSDFPSSWPTPLTNPIPAAGIPATRGFFTGSFYGERASPAQERPPISQVARKVAAEPDPPIPDYTDDDLRNAFSPIVEEAIRKAVYAKEGGIDTYLEPMLRATIRRALAEYTPASRPFHAPGSTDRFLWRLQALFTSRSFEDILFEKTRRFQVEEVFVVDAATLALVSFASCDPARHASARRVSNTVQRLALQMRDENGQIKPSFELTNGRSAVTRQGRHVHLIAVLRGHPNELVLADLEFSLRRIEDAFRERFKPDGGPLLHLLQPFLEDCLLIQAPATAA